MERKTLLALKEERWVELWDGRGVEVLLVPSNMPDLAMARLIGSAPERIARDICTNAFIDFRGYTDDGNPVENTLENRLEFYSLPPCRDAINTQLELTNIRVLTGEEVAAND